MKTHLANPMAAAADNSESSSSSSASTGHSGARVAPPRPKRKTPVPPLCQASTSLSALIQSNPPVAAESLSSREKIKSTRFHIDTDKKSSSAKLSDSVNFLALSPRSSLSPNTVTEIPTVLSVKMINTLDEIRDSQNSHYAFPSIQDIDEAMEYYFRQTIRDYLVMACPEETGAPIEVIFEANEGVFKQLLHCIKSHEAPIVSLCHLHLREYVFGLTSQTGLLKDVKNVIESLIQGNTSGFGDEICFSEQPEPLDFLIEVLRNYSKSRIGTVLSYIILGNKKNKIPELLALLEKWNNINLEGLISEVDKIRKNPVHRFTPAKEYHFKPEDIPRTYCPGSKLIPNLVMVDNVPLRLDGFNNFKEFLHFLLSHFQMRGLNLDLTEDQLQTCVSEFVTTGAIAPPLLVLLGLSTVSCNQTGVLFFLDTFTMFRHLHPTNLVMCTRQVHGKVNIYFQMKHNFGGCNLPFTLTIYPKVSPDSYGYVEDRPLAEVTCTWIGKVCKKYNATEGSQEFTINYTFESELEIIKCHFCEQKIKVLEDGVEKEITKRIATEQEMEYILTSLKLPLESRSSKVLRTISDPLRRLGKVFGISKSSGSISPRGSTSRRSTVSLSSSDRATTSTFSRFSITHASTLSKASKHHKSNDDSEL